MDISIPLTFQPLTPSTWPDFVQLFEEHGIQNGCWCMYWRVQRDVCQRNYGEGNKKLFHAIVESGKVPGILAYHDGRPVAWCSVAPREDTSVLDRSRTLKRVDDQPVWSIVCFFVSKPYRQQGMTEALIEAAVNYAASQEARIVEAYPLRTEITKMLPYERYMGILTTFERSGFQPAAQRSDRRVLLRRDLYPPFTFLDPGRLVDDDLELVLKERVPAIPELGYVPVFRFRMVIARSPSSEQIALGYVELRIGSTRNLRLYGGHFAYAVLPEFRGHHYGRCACKLLFPLARQYGMQEAWITCNPENIASRRTCELLGAELVEIVELPPDHEMFLEGDCQKCRYHLSL